MLELAEPAADALAEQELAAAWAQSWGKNTADSAEPRELVELADSESVGKELALLEQEPANTDSLADAAYFVPVQEL